MLTNNSIQHHLKTEHEMLSNNFGLHLTDANGTVGFVIEIVEFFFEADIFEAFLALAAVHAPPGLGKQQNSENNKFIIVY